MPIFSIIKEEELEEIRLLKADEAVDEEALRKIDALLSLVKAARTQISEIGVHDQKKFASNFLQDLKESRKEGGKFQQLIRILETELQNADAELDGERERIERLSSISAKIVNVMEQISQQESSLLKLPAVRGRVIIEKLKRIDDEEKRELRAKAKAFKIFISWLNSIKVSLRELSYSAPNYIYSVAYHGKSARESYESASESYKIYKLAPISPNDLQMIRHLKMVNNAFLESDKILQGVETRLTAIKNFLEWFRHYLNKTFAESRHALEFEQMLERLYRAIR